MIYRQECRHYCLVFPRNNHDACVRACMRVCARVYKRCCFTISCSRPIAGMEKLMEELHIGNHQDEHDEHEHAEEEEHAHGEHQENEEHGEHDEHARNEHLHEHPRHKRAQQQDIVQDRHVLRQPARHLLPITKALEHRHHSNQDTIIDSDEQPHIDDADHLELQDNTVSGCTKRLNAMPLSSLCCFLDVTPIYLYAGNQPLKILSNGSLGYIIESKGEKVENKCFPFSHYVFFGKFFLHSSVRNVFKCDFCKLFKQTVRMPSSIVTRMFTLTSDVLLHTYISGHAACKVSSYPCILVNC